jgi:tetratricopeptide (TPR) repeat protein
MSTRHFKWLLTLVAAFFGVCCEVHAGDAGKRFALLIGVNRYDNRTLEDLRFAERDVVELARLLKGNYQVELLLGRAVEKSKQATKANIDAALDKLLCAGLTKDDTVLVALAGHGQQCPIERDGRKHDEPFFCPRDALPTDAKTLVNLSLLIERLGERGGGANMLLVDACRNDRDPTRSGGFEGELALRLPKGMAAYFSCSKGEKAQESEKAGGGHGLFFYYVLEGLKSAELRNGRGEVKWDRLVAYVNDRIEVEAPRLLGTGGPVQTPHQISNLARAPIVVAGMSPLTESLATTAEYYKRGLEFFNRKDYTKAIALYSDAIRLDPKNVEAYHERGRARHELRDYEQARADYDETLRLDPLYAHAYNNRGRVWEALKDLDRAEADYNRALRLNKAYYHAYTNRGNVWLARKQYDKALADYRDAIRANSQYDMGYNNLAWFLATCPDERYRDGKKALQLARTACELSSWKNPVFIDTLAAAHAEAGDFQSAIDWEKKALGFPDFERDFGEVAHKCLELYGKGQAYRLE